MRFTSCPLGSEEEEKKAKRAKQTKALNEKLEGFLDLVDPSSTEPVDEGEMSNLAAGFAAQMRKRDASA